MSNAIKCVGIIGKIFGHKFRITIGGLEGIEYRTNYCSRCGVHLATLAGERRTGVTP